MPIMKQFTPAAAEEEVVEEGVAAGPELRHSRGELPFTPEELVVAAQHGRDVAGCNSGLQGAAVVHDQRHPEGNHLAQGVREKQRLVLGLFLRVLPARLARLRRRDLFSGSLQGREPHLRQDD